MNYLAHTYIDVFAMLLTTLATIGGIGSSIAAAIGSARQAGNAVQTLDNNYRDIDRMLRSRYRSDYTKRSDFQSLMTKQKELLDAQYAREKGVNAVIGGNDAAVYAQKRANAQSVASTMSNAGAAAASYKEGVENQIARNQSQRANTIAADQSRRAQTIAAAGGNALKAMFGLVDADTGQLDGLLKKTNA